MTATIHTAYVEGDRLKSLNTLLNLGFVPIKFDNYNYYILNL